MARISQAEFVQQVAGKPHVSMEDFETLAGFKTHSSLNFCEGATFARDGFRLLKHSKTLGRLHFKKNIITLENLTAITDLENLAVLDFSNCILPDASLSFLAKCRKLIWFWVGGCGITREGIQNVVKLENLQWLDLSGADLDDDNIQVLRLLRKLQTLWFRGTNVTDAGLVQLSSLHKLTNIAVGSKITTQGVDKFKVAQFENTLGNICDAPKEIIEILNQYAAAFALFKYECADLEYEARLEKGKEFLTRFCTPRLTAKEVSYLFGNSYTKCEKPPEYMTNVLVAGITKSKKTRILTREEGGTFNGYCYWDFAKTKNGWQIDNRFKMYEGKLSSNLSFW